MMVGTVQNEKQTKVRVIATRTLLGNKVTKKQKQIKLQLYNKQYLIVKGCYDENIKLDRKKKT